MKNRFFGLLIVSIGLALAGGAAAQDSACCSDLGQTGAAHSAKQHKHYYPSSPNGEFVAQPVVYPPANAARFALPVLGDGSTPAGGIAPASNVYPDIPSNFKLKGWVGFGSPAGIDGLDAKFRTHCNFSHIAYDDPLILPGRYGASHLHTFFGNTGADASSTYESLRLTGGSTCGGGLVNRSGYWYPAVLKDNALGNGETFAIRPNFIIVYYNVGRAKADTDRISPIPRGLGYAFGFDPSDPTDSMQHGEVLSANRRASGMSYLYSSNGFIGWSCEKSNGSNANSPARGQATQPYLANADGSATLTCPPREAIVADVVGPQCWDGVNLRSPNGRMHVRHYIRNSLGMGDICPLHWYEIATVEFKIFFTHNGPDDYKNWYLSSDRMPGMKKFRNGESMHADWLGAWDYKIMRTWMRECTGTTVDGRAGTSRSCIDTQFGDGRKGVTSGPAPDGSRVPQLVLSKQYNVRTRFIALPKRAAAPGDSGGQ